MSIGTNGFASGRTSGEYLAIDRAGMEIPTTIIKRDGRIVSFDIERIEQALTKCFASLNRTSQASIEDLSRRVINIIAAKSLGAPPTVEGVQDIVEMVLQAAGEFEAAKHYILYRAEHAKKRVERPVPEYVRQAFAESDQYFPMALQKFQFFDKYARFNYDLGRRETWVETVDRTVSFLHELAGSRLPVETYERVRHAILEMRSMPSMRMLAMAGAAARRNNIAIYNCSYQPVESIDSFVEALIISMSGCGVGFSVEGRYVENFPRIRRQTNLELKQFVVEDSAEGWAQALCVGLETWFEGGDIRFDLSQLRSAGAPLRTKGGRASGPEPLRVMLDFVRSRILARQGSYLRSVDAHDIMCSVGNAAVSGGVRRTALISLFDYDDDEMHLSKSGDFERENSQRWNANNSAVWPEGGLTQPEFISQFLEMVQSGRGEPGIFNRQAANVMRPARRQAAEFGANPCVTGDTWVAVADGRGRVRMADLVADGGDVDVFTVKDGQVAIRTMRNPRQTGAQVPVYRVTFADGTYIRATANHRFALLNGGERTTLELQPNDALIAMSVFSYQKRGLPAARKVAYDQSGSYRMVQFGGFRKSEHRLIYAHHTGEPVLTGTDQHIHHRDYDGRNNHISNLERLSAKDHAALHRERMLGDHNPARRLMSQRWRTNLSRAVSGARNGNAKPITNQDLEQAICAFIADLGYRPSIEAYQVFAQANGLPQTFQQYRRDYFGGTLQETLASIAQRLGFDAPPYAKLAVKQSELPIQYRDGIAYVTRTCEVCGQPFEVRFNRREQATCGASCGQKLYYTLHGTEQRQQLLQHAHAEAKVDKRQRQVAIYNDLVFALGRHPNKHEWVAACKEYQVSSEIARSSSPFRSWRDLQTESLATNHRVVAVESDGDEDVYTGTVDETHTFLSIGTERFDTKNRAEMAYVLSWQCGEIVLRPWQFCNLSAAVARHEDNFESLREKVEVAAIIGTIQSLATHFPGLRPQWQHNCEEERLLGVDITGQMDSPIAQDAGVKERLRGIAIAVNQATAHALGVNAAAAITTVKPSGNSSQLLNCSSGLHSRWSPYYIRNVRVAAHSPIFKVLRDASVPMDPENGQTPENANTWVIHFPVKSPDSAITRQDRTAIIQCEFWLQNKTYWTEHNPSCFTGDTRVITDRGLMSFHQMEDYIGDDPTRTPLVLGKEGQWVQATFHSLGEQEIWELVVERCGIQQTIRTTKDHVWPVTSPMRRFRDSALELVQTSQLPVGSRNYKLFTVNPREQITLDLEGILHGITFGDGTRSSGHEGRTRYCSIALCNDPNGVDSRALAPLFAEAGFKPNVREDRQQIQFFGLPEHWKTLPAADESPEYLRGFIAGWFAADGHIGSTITISSVNRDALAWLQTIAPRAGLATPTDIGEHFSESGFAPLTWYTLALVKESLDVDFFLLEGKRERFSPAKFAKYWKVASVRNTGKREPVYCMEVQEAEPYFTLEGNILTHNCTITYRPDEVIDLMKWVWEHRDQIGGLSFLPTFDAKYDNMPYVEITREEYERLAASFPEIDFSKIYRYEEEDLTNAAQELACSSGTCEIDL